MDVIDKYSYWEDVAEYDLGTAEAMLNSGSFLDRLLAHKNK